MLNITAISGGDAAEYYLRPCGGAGVKLGPADYELAAVVRGEPPGEWATTGRNVLGLVGAIDADEFRTVVNELKVPRTVAARLLLVQGLLLAQAGNLISARAYLAAAITMAKRGPEKELGSRPRAFRTPEQRIAEWQAEHPKATPEDLAAFRMKAQKGQRHAQHAYDLTFSLPKSWSVAHAAFDAEGRHEDAAKLIAAAKAGVHAALAQAAERFGYTRKGVAGPKVGAPARATTTYVQASDWVVGIFQHHESREGDPQVHWHAMVLNRVPGPDGQWRALHAKPLMESKHMLDATFLSVAEAEATRSLGIQFATRPDGKAREIVGVSPEVRDLFSSRHRALSEKAQELVDAWTADRGYPPPAILQWRMNQRAWAATRKKKPEAPPTRAESLAAWEAATRKENRESLADVAYQVDEASAGVFEVPMYSPEEVGAQALAELEDGKGTWNYSHLYHAIRGRLPAMLAIEPALIPQMLTDQTDQTLRTAEVVSLAAPPVGRVPKSLQNPRTGRSVFEAPEGDRWTTVGHLAKEDSLVARLDQTGAPAVSVASARALVAREGLFPDQEAVVVGLLSGRNKLEVVVGPAGAGKSRMVRALSAATTEVWGNAPVGFTISQQAAENLAREGHAVTHNIAAYLDWRERVARGAASDMESATFAIPKNAPVIVDEAGAVDTPRLARLIAAVESAGAGKVILVGDTEQIDPVDAGGAFALLIDEARKRERETETVGLRERGRGMQAAGTGERAEPADGPAPRRRVHELREVRRFRSEWEREASQELRVGDISALAQYDAHARIKGGPDAEAVKEGIVGDFLYDHTEGRDAIMLTGTEDLAADLSSRARERLVRAGLVDADGVELRDKTRAGVGDIVMTRQNKRTLGVVNREVWQVVGATSHGDLEVRKAIEPSRAGERAWGEVQHLPADYVRTQLQLAYAGTVDAKQGGTVYGGHLLVDAQMGRSHLYPGLTRGTERNVAHVITELPVRRQGEPVEAWHARAQTPLARMVQVVEKDDHTVAARTVIAAEQDRSDHLGHLGPIWQTLMAEDRAIAHRGALQAALGFDVAARVLEDPKAGGVMHLLRAAETNGHDPREIVAQAMTGRTLDGARSPAAVLYAQIDRALRATPRGPDPVAFTYRDRTPAPAIGYEGNDVREYHREVAAAMDARVTKLGDEVLAAQPQWAIERFGAVPEDPIGRAGWAGRAGVVAAYREQFGWSHERSPIGPQPTRAEPERLWVWNRAADVLGMDPREREMAALTDAQLRNREQDWERQLEWMPRNVDADLREAELNRQEARLQVLEAREAGDHDALPDREAAVLEMDERIAALDEIAKVRAQAYEQTAGVRERAEEARAELDRRGEMVDDEVEPEPAPEAPEPEPEDVPEPEAAPEPAVEAEEALALSAVMSRVIDRQVDGPVPMFGSPRWLELEHDDPVRRAAIADAAVRAWNFGSPLGRDRDGLYARLEAAEPLAAEAGTGGSAQKQSPSELPIPKDDRAGDMVSPEDREAILAEHAQDADVEVQPLSPRVLAQVREGRDEADAARDEPAGDIDSVLAVLGWAEPQLADEAPEFGTVAWAQLEDTDPAKEAAETRAALDWWNLGEDLDRLKVRVEAAEDKASAAAIAAAEVERQEQQREDAKRERVEDDRAERERVAAVEAEFEAEKQRRQIERAEAEKAERERVAAGEREQAEPAPEPVETPPEPAEVQKPTPAPEPVAEPEPVETVPEPEPAVEVAPEPEPEPAVAVEPEPDPSVALREELARAREAAEVLAERQEPAEPERAPDPEPVAERELADD